MWEKFWYWWSLVFSAFCGAMCILDLFVWQKYGMGILQGVLSYINFCCAKFWLFKMQQK